MDRFRTAEIFLIACGTLLAPLGCDGQRDQVREYNIPKEKPAAVEAEPTGRAAQPGVIQWDLPDGWTSRPASSSMRFATLSAGEGDAAIEVAITRLGPDAGTVASNVNRWRQQVGLEPLSAGQAAASPTELKARGATGTLVDLAGPKGADESWQPPRMMVATFSMPDATWFIKATGTSGAIEQHKAAFVSLCESVRFGPRRPQAPAPEQPAIANAGDNGGGGGPKWGDLPDGWTLDDQPSSMSIASMTVSDGSQEASLTITPLGGSQDLLQNINRWRRQVGLPALEKLSDDPPLPIDVAGEPGYLVDLAGLEVHTLAVLSVRGDTTWFYKLSGPDPLVASQKAAFAAFVKSVSF